MKEELHLFIIWQNAREKQEEILQDIKENFKIIKLYEVEWDKEKFSNNLSRFYGTNLPKGSGKEVRCGNGKFLLVILKDLNPIYKERETSKGKKIVNINMFDKKEQYRQITGKDDKVHGTNSEIETNHDLTLLLGKNIEDFLKENNNDWDGKIEQISTNLFGEPQWNTVKEMFYALNNCLNYAVLRNHESLPNEIYENDHNDIDIICESLEDAAYVLNATPVFEEKYRVHYKTQVEGRIAYFDLRHIGDNYYYEKLEKDILKHRVFNEKGFYILSKDDYFYTLLYHALIHKPVFKEDYKQKLMNMGVENVNMETSIEEYSKILKNWMKKNEYIMVDPEDQTVSLNPRNTPYFRPMIYKGIEEQLKINELQLENENLKAEVSRLKTIIEGIEDSRAWKLTKPLRSIRKKIRGNNGTN